MSTTKTTMPVTWFEVHTPDPDRARSFYGDVFGWDFQSVMPGYDMISLGERAPIGGGIASTGPEHRPMAVFNVQVEDVRETCERITEAGGTVVAEPQETEDGLAFAYVADLDGSVFGVWKPPSS